MVKRRAFLAAALGASVAGFMPTSFASQVTPSRKLLFNEALTKRPWLSAYQTITNDSYQSRARINHGKLPDDFGGDLFRNGPARHEVGEYRYGHWFDGDGMIHRYRFAEGEISHRANLIQTQKLKRERAAGKALYSAFGSAPSEQARVTSPDDINVANISVLHHHGKLMALWEAGSPWEIEQDSLQASEPYSFDSSMNGVPFSAHPRVEPDGTLWNFGYFSSGRVLVLWHISPKGQLVKAGRISLPEISMPHDFVVTARHLVIMMPPFHYGAAGNNFLDQHKWYPDRPTQLMIVSKEDFDDVKFVELPAQWVFHFSNGWEDDQGVIHFEAARSDDPSAMQTTFKDIMSGIVTPSTSASLYGYRVDTRSWRASESEILAYDCEFPAIEPHLSGRRHEQVVMLSAETHASHPQLNELRVVNMKSQTTERYRYPDHQIPEEHLLVRAQGGKSAYVVGTAHDWRHQQTVINLFRSDHVEDGPVMSATLDYAMPIGLHGRFVA